MIESKCANCSMKARYDKKVGFHNQQNLEMAYLPVSGMEGISHVTTGK